MKLLCTILILSFSLQVWATNSKRVVFWLSIDGMKYEYLEKTESPNFKELLSKSVYTKKLRPAYPSITFPSHITQATGVRVKDHGIPLNFFYDHSTNNFHSYPGNSNLLEAEPIWQTVKRENLRSAVIDWPLSYQQSGDFKSDYYENEFNKKFTDEERIEHALKIWEEDLKKGNQFNLFMAYLSEVDSAGHEYGPNDARVFERVERTDKLIRKIADKIKELAEKNKDYEYFLLITSDHGMEEVKYGVNLELMINLPADLDIKLAASGPIGHLFFPEMKMTKKNQILRDLERRMKMYPFIKMYQRNKLPKKWGYNHPTRVGDLVFILDSEYCFLKSSTQVVAEVAEVGGPRGMHGFDAKINSNMHGLLSFWKYPEHPKRTEVRGPIETLHLHATVSKLFDIEPSSKSDKKVIRELLP